MKIALLGNPNTGKSSIFNLLTGLRQKIGNFPGVTVEKKSGFFTHNEQRYDIVDFPGTYSLTPRSLDEEVVANILGKKDDPSFPDLIIAVVDSSRLENNLFLFTQLYELQLPTILILNMWDLSQKKGIIIDLEALQKEFPDTTIVTTNARVGMGKERILAAIKEPKTRNGNFFLNDNNTLVGEFTEKDRRNNARARKDKIESIINLVQRQDKKKENSGLDHFFVHPVSGYLFFLAILMVMFQFIFSFASYPMDFIDGTFGNLSHWYSSNMPSGVLTDLISEGIIPGVGGSSFLFHKSHYFFLYWNT